MTQIATTIASTSPLKRTSVVPIGLALFAMFFGAGNLVYPLALGVEAGQNLPYAMTGFLIMGVGVPFLGLYATSLFAGNYEAFFERLGKLPAFLVITFLILIIGPLSAMPRTETITYQTVAPFLPHYFNHLMFSAIYCGLVFLLSYKQTRMMDILGYILSPVKLVTFATLIALGLAIAYAPLHIEQTGMATLSNALQTGYSTMDLLATFFFCSIAYTAITRQADPDADHKQLVSMTLKACIIGAICLGLVYIGFMAISAGHAADLKGVSTEQLISAVSYIVLGRFGAFIVCVCITFACFSTAMALTEVSGTYLYKQVFRTKVPKILCLAGVVLVMFIMSSLGFAGIMAIATPILIAIYPALVVLCIANILYKTVGFKYVKLPVLITIVITYFANF